MQKQVGAPCWSLTHLFFTAFIVFRCVSTLFAVVVCCECEFIFYCVLTVKTLNWKAEVNKSCTDAEFKWVLVPRVCFFSFWFEEIDEELKHGYSHGYGSPERPRFTHYFLHFNLTTPSCFTHYLCRCHKITNVFLRRSSRSVQFEKQRQIKN